MVYLLIIAFVVIAGLRILQQYQRGLHLRLGRYKSTRSPGLIWIIPIIERLQVLDVRVISQDIEPQETMPIDNVPVKLRAGLLPSRQSIARLADRSAGAAG